MLLQDLTQLNSVLAKAIDGTTQDLLEELKNIIKETVYSYDEQWDGRTGQFGEAWETEAAQAIGDIVIGRIFPNNRLDWNPDEFQHGNIFEPVRDSGSGLDGLYTILDNGANNGNNPFGFPQTPPHDYWDMFINYVDRNLDNIFVKNCRAVGLNVRASVSAR